MSDTYIGQLLIATPRMLDPRFKKSVILICEFSNKAVMGLILNKEISDLTTKNLLDKVNIPRTNDFSDNSVFNGGPVHSGQCFILHSNEKSYKSTTTIAKGIFLTTSIQILKDIGLNNGPLKQKIFLGCSVWDYDQFNREMRENSWFILDSNLKLIFKYPLDEFLWTESIKKLGVKKENLVNFSGNA